MIDESKRYNNWSDDDWNYIKGLSFVIESVPELYIRFNKEYHIERIFSYELYYRWKKYLEDGENNPQDVFLNAELSKHYEGKVTYNFPDMVLHGDYTNSDLQYIIGEIKSSRNYVTDRALKKDLESLRDGIRNLGYHCGVLIYLGGKKSTINKRLVNIKSQLENNDFKILLIWVRNHEDIIYELI